VGDGQAGPDRHHPLPGDADRKRKTAGQCALRAGTQAQKPQGCAGRGRHRRTEAGPGAGCSPPAAVGAAGAGKEHGRLPELGQGRHARRRGPPPAGHHRAGVGHPEGGARLRSGRGNGAGRGPAEHRGGKRSRGQGGHCPAAQRQCGPGHLPAAGHGAARGVPGAAVRHRTAGLQSGAGRCTV